jgi:hypothetical protein
MTIATTRIHHDLVDYAYGSTQKSDMHCFLSFSELTIAVVIIAPSGKMLSPSRRRKQSISIQITLDQVEVSMYTSDDITEQYSRSQPSERDSRISIDGQQCDPQNGLIIVETLRYIIPTRVVIYIPHRHYTPHI